MLSLTILGSGSGGNSTVIDTGEDALIIDAGFSGVEMGRRLETCGVPVSRLRAMLVTHEHDDHSTGLRIFCKKAGGLPAYANALTAERLSLLNRLPEKVTLFHNGTPFRLGPFTVEPFSVSHDAVDPVGFVVRVGEIKISVVTDLGVAGKMVPLKARDSHILVLESNHDPELLLRSSRPPAIQHRILSRRGHLSNQDAVALLPELLGPATRHLVLAHLSEECNRPRLARELAATALAKLKRQDVALAVAEQDRVSPRFTL